MSIARSFVPLLVGLAWGWLTKLGRRSHIAHFSHFDKHRALGETGARHLALWNPKNRKPASQSLPKRGICVFPSLSQMRSMHFWIRWWKSTPLVKHPSNLVTLACTFPFPFAVAGLLAWHNFQLHLFFNFSIWHINKAWTYCNWLQFICKVTILKQLKIAIIGLFAKITCHYQLSTVTSVLDMIITCLKELRRECRSDNGKW